MAFRLKALLASGALILSSGAAFAASATATTQVNVRSGPGTTYGVVDTLPAGETVNVLGCGSTWCEISMGADGTGFVAESYLDHRGGRQVRETVIVDDEPEIVGLSIGGYYESRPYYIRDGYYFYGGRWYGDRPGRPGWRDRSWRRWDERREARIDWRRDRAEDRRDNRRERIEDRRDDRRERIEDRRDDRRDAMQDRREERMDDRRDAVREQRQERREQRIDARQDQRADQRMEAREPRTERAPEPARSLRDGGDRMGLDRSGSNRGGGRD